ncbi:MAG: Lyase-like protein [Nitrospinae bacterium]|nr:Lyase-like protein [Nitrospinota bacterium]
MKRPPLTRFLAVWIACFAFGSEAPSAHSASIVEYLTPTPDSSPTGLAFDRQGNLWITEINGNKIARLDPSAAEPGTSKGIIEYELPNPNSQPHYIIAARDGIVWFTEMGGNRVGRLDPNSGTIQEFDVPTPNSEPHHLAEAPDGSIWFLEFEANKVARLDPGTGQIKEFSVGEGHPHDLAVLDGKIWYTQGGKFWAKLFFNKIGGLDVNTGKVEEIPVPPLDSVPHGMTHAADGAVWFTQMFADKISRLDFSKGNLPSIVEYKLPGKRKRPHDLAVDEKRGAVWFTENHADSIGRLDLAKAKPGTSQGFDEFKIPTPGAHPSEVAVDKHGNVWFAEMGMYFMGKYQNKIGKLMP